MNNTVEKLLNKGFSGADIHFFMQRFDIGIFIPMPPPSCMLIVHIPPDATRGQIKSLEEESRSKVDNWYEAQRSKERLKWEEANIAADFEIHK